MAVSVSLLVAAMQSLVKSPWSDQENENVDKHNWQKGRTSSSEGDRVKQRQAEQPLNGPSEQIVLLLNAVSKVKIEFSILICFFSLKKLRAEDSFHYQWCWYI